MKAVFIGCVLFSEMLLKELWRVRRNQLDLVGIVTRDKSPLNADFISLKNFADNYQIPVFVFEKKHDELKLVEWLKNLKPDIIFCLGWPFLLNKEITVLPKSGVIGYHPTALPKNRGRHPIVWTLVLGLKITASTFFLMDAGADSGDIINQKLVKVLTKDNAESLYKKLLECAKKQIVEIVNQLATGSLKRYPQDHTQANFWRKRNERDGQIDWRMSAESIYNLIRALTKPYIGAHCIYQTRQIKIWQSEVVKLTLSNIEPGKILKVVDGKVIVKCGSNAIKLINHDFHPLPLKGEYL